MIRIGVVGLGKMGLSHLAMINAHPAVVVGGVCDMAGYILDVLGKYTGIRTFARFETMLREAELDGVIVATPSMHHGKLVRAALDSNLHVFCEKPFILDPVEGVELAALAKQKGLVNQVGYHNRFVGAFQEVKNLLDCRAIGSVTHVLAEAYGPVVLRPKGSTWRSQRIEGGGCLYDYAAHPINLVNWFLGTPLYVGGTVLNGIFSKETDDEVSCTLYFADDQSAQICVNWSDESHRKMSTKVTVWGTSGRIYADRQEIQVYFRETASLPPGYRTGWNIRYTTDLTKPVWFYLRGEEYSAQLDYFIDCIRSRATDNVNSFASANVTDRVMARMIDDATSGARISVDANASIAPARKRWHWLARMLRSSPD
jgi:predicted dehydrogenase